MEIAPTVRSSWFAQLDPGDLFIVDDGTGSYVALAVKDPSATEKMALLLGPASPAVPKVPILTNLPQMRVVSFGKDYKLRLPCDSRRWFAAEPPDESSCLVLAEDKPYLRALYGYAPQVTRCYIGVQDGVLLMDASHSRFARPSRDCAYTSDWAFLTSERDAREIISSPPAP